MNNQPAMAVLYTVNLAPLAGFYQEVAGLRVRKAERSHVVLENGTFRLIVHRIPDQHANSVVTTVPPVVRETAAIKLSFPVNSIAAARDAAARLGGCVYGSEREWVYESTNVCDGWDSDGNVFQLLQLIG